MPQKMPSAVRLARSSRVWDYLAAFMDTALTLRLPEEVPAEPGPVTLRDVDPASGYLIHPRAIEEILGTKWFEFRLKEDGTTYDTIKWDPQNPEIHEATPVYDDEQGMIPFEQLVRSASDVPAAERHNHMWMASPALLSAWLDLHNSYKVKERIMASITSTESAE